MASKALTTIAIVLTFNLLLVTLFNPTSAQLPLCPRNALSVNTCASVLNILNVVAGASPPPPCCSLIAGLVDIDAAACLCTAVTANVLGIININIPIDITILLNDCGRTLPAGAFICPPAGP